MGGVNSCVKGRPRRKALVSHTAPQERVDKGPQAPCSATTWSMCMILIAALCLACHTCSLLLALQLNQESQKKQELHAPGASQQAATQQLVREQGKLHEQHPKEQRTSGNGVDKDTAMLSEPLTNSTSPFASSTTPLPNGHKQAESYLNRASSPNVRLQHEYRGTMHSHDELARISTLQSLDILDTEPCPKYDDITKLLCSIFKVPIAQLSLVDSDRQWCKSVQGLDVRQINRDIAFCAWVLLPKHPTALVVEDTHEDARYSKLITSKINFKLDSALGLASKHCFTVCRS